LLVTGTLAALWSNAPAALADSAWMSPPERFATPHMRNMPAMKLSKNPTIAVPLFMIFS
jgi:hypothetical protein